MSVNTVPKVCPKCLSGLHIRPKILLIGKASPVALFPEERAGYRRREQLSCPLDVEAILCIQSFQQLYPFGTIL